MKNLINRGKAISSSHSLFYKELSNTKKKQYFAKPCDEWQIKLALKNFRKINTKKQPDISKNKNVCLINSIIIVKPLKNIIRQYIL